MPKRVVAEHYQSAYDIMYGKWTSISPCDIYSDDGEEHPLHAENLSSEQLLIKKEAWEELSEEAKEVITTVLYVPNEIVNLITTPNTKNITLRSVKKYFIEKWKSKFIVDLTLKEIAFWIAKL